MRVQTANPEQVACNLPAAACSPSPAPHAPSPALQPEVVFESTGDMLPAGHVLRVDMGHLPLALMAYARWIAVATLALLVATVSRLVIWRKRSRVAGIL